MEKLRIAVDFDGTIAEPIYPKIGQPIYGARTVLRELVAQGHKIILWTCRTGKDLEKAVALVERLGVELHAVNANGPGDRYSSHPKAWADIYIDDAALGAPTTRYRTIEGTRFRGIDWSEVRRWFVFQKFLD